MDLVFSDIDEYISRQDDLLESFLIGSLLYGEQVDEKTLERYFPADRYKSFITAVVCISLKSDQLQQLSELASETCGEKTVATSISYCGDTVCVFLCEKETYPEKLMTDLRDAVTRLTDCDAEIAMGSAVQDIRRLQTSYHDALLTLRHGAVGEIPEIRYPVGMVRDFSRQLRQGHPAQAMFLLNQMESALPKLSDAAQQMMLFDLLHAFIIGIQKDDGVVPEYVAMELIPPLNGQKLFTLLRCFIAESQVQTEQTDQNAAKGLQNDMLNFVDSNCLDSSLCLMSVADYLGTTIYTVSRMFKESTGTGFKEYVTDRRLQHACHLLTDSPHMTVAAVAAESGFESVTYFTTIFKERYGVPPTKFRTMNAVRDDTQTDQTERGTAI